MAEKCWALPSPGTHVPRMMPSLLGILGECSSKENSLTLTIHIRRPEHPELLLHLPPSIMEAADSQWKGKLREGHVCCSAQRHESTHHLPPALALPQVWYPDGCIPLFTLHCKTSPVYKQAISGSVCVWRGSIACGGWQQPSMAACRAESPAGSRLEGQPCPSPATSGTAGRGLQGKWCGGQLAKKTPSAPQQTRFSTGGAISALRSLAPAQSVQQAEGCLRLQGGSSALADGQGGLAGKAKERSTGTVAFPCWLDNWAHLVHLHKGMKQWDGVASCPGL